MEKGMERAATMVKAIPRAAVMEKAVRRAATAKNALSRNATTNKEMKAALRKRKGLSVVDMLGATAITTF